MPPVLVERARAKVNLTLRLSHRRDDGWHELESLVAFASSADRLTLEPRAGLHLEVEGPRADALNGASENLVLRAARHLADEIAGLKFGAFRLHKRLPVAAGIGGGSADAAAALRLIARVNGIEASDPRLYAAATATGADVPVCLDSKARMMSGIGDKLGAPRRLPPLYSVLVNPGVALETAAVFREIGLAPGEVHNEARHPALPPAMTFESLIALLKKSHNDMEDAASVLAPVIGHVLALLSAARGVRLVRMSGSGATCFALFETRHAAARAAKAIARDHADWWVEPALLR